MDVIEIQRPDSYNFSKNPLFWRFFCIRPTEDGCMVEIKLTLRSVYSSTPEFEYILALKPGADGYVNFYLQDIVDSYLEYEYPSNAVINEGKNIKYLDLVFRRISTADPDTAYLLSAVETNFYIIKGGIENIKNDYNNYFLNYHTPNKPFATWMPSDCFVGKDDSFYISILFANDFTALDLSARNLLVTAEFTDSTTEVLTIPFPVPPTTPTVYFLYHIKAGAEDLGINAVAAGRQLYRYKIQVVNAATPTTVYSAVYTFYIDYRTFYNTKIFHYYNSLGGIDFVRVLGDTEEDYNRNFSEAEKITGTITVGSPADALYTQNQITRYNNFKSDSGYRHTAKQAIYLQELLMSMMVWEVMNDVAKRVFILNKTSKLIQKSDGKFSFPIEWRYGFTDVVFTPPAVDLGVGSDTQFYHTVTCGIPAGLSATDIGAGGTGERIIQFNYTYGSDGVVIIIEYKEVGAITWTVLPETPAIAVNVNLLIGETYEWRTKVKCAEGLYSAYVNGTNFTV